MSGLFLFRCYSTVNCKEARKVIDSTIVLEYNPCIETECSTKGLVMGVKCNETYIIAYRAENDEACTIISGMPVYANSSTAISDMEYIMKMSAKPGDTHYVLKVLDNEITEYVSQSTKYLTESCSTV